MGAGRQFPLTETVFVIDLKHTKGKEKKVKEKKKLQGKGGKLPTKQAKKARIPDNREWQETLIAKDVAVSR